MVLCRGLGTNYGFASRRLGASRCSHVMPDSVDPMEPAVPASHAILQSGE